MTATVEEQQQIAATLELLSEALADAEAILAADDNGWRRVWGSSRDINVKVLTEGTRAEEVAAALRDRLTGTTVSVRRPGGGVRIEEGTCP